MTLFEILILIIALLLVAGLLRYAYIQSYKDFIVYYREPAQLKNRDYDYYSVNLRNNVLNYVSEQEYNDNYLNNPIVQTSYSKWLNSGWKN